MTVSTKSIVVDDQGKEKSFSREEFARLVEQAAADFVRLSLEEYEERVWQLLSRKEMVTFEQLYQTAILEGLSYISEEEPDWTFVCARLYLRQLYREAARQRRYDERERYGDFYSLLVALTEQGVYSPFLLERYTKEEVDAIGAFLDPEKDKLFTYIGLRTLADRYLARDYERRLYELPQERFLVIAMTLMANEPPKRRLELVKEAYWALSNLYMTVATPTLAMPGSHTASCRAALLIRSMTACKGFTTATPTSPICRNRAAASASI